MTEGELKKRLQKQQIVSCNMCNEIFANLELFDKHWDDEHAITWGYGTKYPKVIIGFFHAQNDELIDEAKKEFPKFVYIESYDGDWKPEDILNMRNKEVACYQTWKKKWFGDSE